MATPKSSKIVRPVTRFAGGIAEFDREGTTPDGFAFGRSVDIRSNPQNASILEAPVKESGSVILALPKWGEYVSKNTNTYIYDEAGNIYKRDSSAAYTLLHTVPTSHGNGMAYFGEDDQMYYTSDKTIGRFGPMSSSTPQFVDDFFGSQGGTPLNTQSLQTLSASTQYATRASTVSLQITGDLTATAYVKPTTLPASGATMTVLSKWTEQGNARSYKFGIGTVSNFFGDGSDGALTIAADTTEAPIDSACTGTTGTNTLTATNVSFAAGQKILIHQTQGTGAGNSQINTIQSYTAGTITTTTPLNATYATGAQVRVLKQYTDVTINAGKTYTAKAWNGTVGGILAFLANGTLTVNGTISGIGKGFRGADRPSVGSGNSGKQGEGYNAATYNAVSTAANSSGGGGGGGSSSAAGKPGGGGGHITAGAVGSELPPNMGAGGSAIGGQDLIAQLYFGGGGGSGGNSYNSTTDGGAGGQGGAGGGALVLAAPTVTINTGGLIDASGGAGQQADLGHASGGGGSGAGGSILIYTQTATLGTQLMDASGGTPGYNTNGFKQSGGYGGYGQIHIDYLTSETGTSSALSWSFDSSGAPHSTRSTTSILYTTQDDNLGSSTGYTIFLSLSSDGTAVTTVSKPASLQTGVWQYICAAFDSANKRVEFFLNGASLGTVSTGSLATINSNAAAFSVSADLDGASAPQHLYNGKLDEVSAWARTLTASDVSASYNKLINSSSFGLKGYWRFEGDYTDGSGNSNTLTATNTPTFTTDVPFSAATTRVDLDQTGTGSGNTYALGTTISETTANKQVFVPTKDPQKSVEVYVVAAGTGSWTVTVHDQYNVAVATATIANASLPTSGLAEFIFSSPWRPLTNFTNNYHFHVTSSDGTGTLKCTSANDMSASTFNTYYQFLVEDDYFHPVFPFLNMVCFGNERYVGTLSATIYSPNALVLPSGWRVWSFSLWNEYLAIGCIYGTTPTESDRGRIFFWDGYSQVYNFFTDVPTGGVTAMKNVNTSTLTAFTGYQGDMVVLQPGNIVYGTQSSMMKVRKIPKIDTTTATYVYPGALTTWRGLFRFGVAGYNTSTNVNIGTYSWGSVNYKYPEVLTFDYPLSTATYTGSNIRVGMVLAVNQDLLVGWQSGTGYGVDIISSSNNCAASATLELMVVDDNAVYKQKELNTIVAKFQKLASGQSMQLKYKLDDASDWTLGDLVTSSSLEPTVARVVVPDGLYFEQQIALDMYSTTGVSPLLKGIGIEADMNADEGRLG